MRNILLYCLLAAATAAPASAADGSWTVNSPSGDITTEIGLRDGRLSYAVQFRGQYLIRVSRMGLVMADGTDLSEGFSLESEHVSSADRTWAIPSMVKAEFI